MNPFLLVEVLFSAKEKVGAAAGTYTQMGSSPSAKVPRIGFEPATNGDFSRTTPLFSACDSQLRF
jgi:hypothetical protein